jgi:hypothetical protein
MATKKRGRPADVRKKQGRADAVSFHLMAQRSIDTLRRQKKKGQQRISRSFTKGILPNTARVLSTPDDKVSVCALERDFYEQGREKGTLARLGKEMEERARMLASKTIKTRRDKVHKDLKEFLPEQELRKLFRKK